MLAILFADGLELTSAVWLDPSEPGVQLFEECSRLCPDQRDHSSGEEKQTGSKKMRYEGGV